jgi:hypothetical protein
MSSSSRAISGMAVHCDSSRQRRANARNRSDGAVSDRISVSVVTPQLAIPTCVPAIHIGRPVVARPRELPECCSRSATRRQFEDGQGAITPSIYYTSAPTQMPAPADCRAAPLGGGIAEDPSAGRLTVRLVGESSIGGLGLLDPLSQRLCDLRRGWAAYRRAAAADGPFAH